MPEHSHRYEFGAPRGGWPRFGPDGRRVREDEVHDVRCSSCGEVVGAAPAGATVALDEGPPARVSVDGQVVHTCQAPPR